MGETFQRAKSDKHKQVRMQQIMDAADRQFHERTYHQVTLSTIATEVGIARGGLYKYVDSKEDIFLSLYMQKEHAAVDAVLERVNGHDLSVDEFACEIADVLQHHLDLFKYHQILNAIIEANVTVERLAEFKKVSDGYRRKLLDLFVGGFGVPEERAFELYLTILYHCVYLFDRVAYQDTYVAAMELAGFAIKDVDFVEELGHFVRVQLSDAMR